MPWVVTRTLNMRSSMAPSFRFTKRQPAQKGTRHHAIGRSRGGLTTGIVALVDAPGNLVRFLLLPGQAHNMKGVAPLIRDVPFGALPADRAFDANGLPEEPAERGVRAVIAPKSNRKHPRDYDTEACKCRHLVESHFAGIREFSGMATRHDKTDCICAANCNLAAALIASR